MRMFRADSTGKVRDALKFNDTFALLDPRDTFYSVGTCYHHAADSQYRLDALEYLFNCDEYGYDYVCIFMGKIFPIKDSEIKTLESVWAAAANRNKDCRCWDYF